MYKGICLEQWAQGSLCIAGCTSRVRLNKGICLEQWDHCPFFSPAEKHNAWLKMYCGTTENSAIGQCTHYPINYSPSYLLKNPLPHYRPPQVLHSKKPRAYLTLTPDLKTPSLPIARSPWPHLARPSVVSSGDVDSSVVSRALPHPSIRFCMDFPYIQLQICREIEKEVTEAMGGSWRRRSGSPIVLAIIFIASVPVSLHSHASSVPLLTGINFSDWKERVEFHLGVLDLDLALVSDKPAGLTDSGSRVTAITDSSSATPAATVTSTEATNPVHEAWKRSNRLCLMFMKMTIASNIKYTLLDTDNAKEYLKNVEERFKTADKSLAGTLMAKLTNMKFDGTRGMQEHVLEMSGLAAQLKNLGMAVDEFFLVQFVLNSLTLSPEYGAFHINYNSMKDKWNFNELTNMLIQEEARLKQIGRHSLHFMSHEVKKNGRKPQKGIKKAPTKVGESAGTSKNLKKGKDSDKCHFCKKSGHYQKDCHKRRAWFEKKGIPYNPDHKFK